jgi:hypothetical protein
MALLALAPPAVGTAAFHCQQAAEKILKGPPIAARQRAAKTRQLAELAAKPSQAFPSLGSDLDLLPPLTPWYIASRYPDIDIEPEADNPMLWTLCGAFAHCARGWPRSIRLPNRVTRAVPNDHRPSASSGRFN